MSLNGGGDGLREGGNPAREGGGLREGGGEGGAVDANAGVGSGLRERLSRLPKVALDDAPDGTPPCHCGLDPQSEWTASRWIAAPPAAARNPGSPQSLRERKRLSFVGWNDRAVPTTTSAPTAAASAPVAVAATTPAAAAVAAAAAAYAPAATAGTTSATADTQPRTMRGRSQSRRWQGLAATAAYLIFMLVCLAISLDLFAPLNLKRDLVAAPDEQGDLYSGSQHILDGSFSGQVTISYLRGDSYSGGLRDNRFSGYGQFAAAEGWSIEGEFMDGRLSGKGIYRDQKGVYEGSFENSLPQGQGIYRASSGWTYDGQFLAGKITGQGLFVAADGSEYQGGFLNGYAHGRGAVQSPAWSYDGDFTVGYRNGQGTLTFEDGQTVTAHWDAGQPA